MAIYIGYPAPPTDGTPAFIKLPSATSDTAISATSSTTGTIGGTVYQLKLVNLTISNPSSSNCWLHSGTSNYQSSYTNFQYTTTYVYTYKSTTTYSNTTTYLFNAAIYGYPWNTWSYPSAWTGTGISSSLESYVGGGSAYKKQFGYSNNSTSGVRDNVTVGPNSTSYGTSIVELYQTCATSTSSYSDGVGLGLTTASNLNTNYITSNTSPGYGERIYSFYSNAFTTSSNRAIVNGYNNRRVYAIHNVVQSGSSAAYKVAKLGYETSSSSYPTNAAYSYISNISFNTWASYTGGDGHIYKSISVNSTSQWVYTTYSVTKGKEYTFKLFATGSSTGGIVLYTSTQSTPPTNSNFSTSGFGRVVATESGASATVSYLAESSGTIYIYFRSGSSITRATGGEYSVAVGDVEIIDNGYHDQYVTIIGNGAGGTGTSSTTITYGTAAGTSVSFTAPTRTATPTSAPIEGYYTSPTPGQGTKYINANKTLARQFDYISSATLQLYPHWSNTVTYSLKATSFSTYCTTEPYATSKLIDNKQIIISNSGASCLSGTVTINISGTGSSGITIYTPPYDTMTISSGKSSGTYSVTLTITSPNVSSSYLQAESKSYTFSYTITAVTLSSINVHLHENPIGVGSSTPVWSYGNYSNGTSGNILDVVNYSNLVIGDPYVEITEMGIWVDDFDYDDDELESIANDQGFDDIQEYMEGCVDNPFKYGCEYYTYVGEMTLYGDTVYLWYNLGSRGNNPGGGDYIVGLVSNTKNVTTIRNASIENNWQNYHNSDLLMEATIERDTNTDYGSASHRSVVKIVTLS